MRLRTIHLKHFVQMALRCNTKYGVSYKAFYQSSTTVKLRAIDCARTYLQLQLWQCGAGNVYLLALSRVQNLIVDQSTARNFKICRKLIQYKYKKYV